MVGRALKMKDEKGTHSMSSVPPTGPPGGSVPRIVPPPDYTGDQPTVPNPVYRGPTTTEGTRSAKSTVAPPNDGRRGNVAIGVMLFVGLAVTGAAGVMLSRASGGSTEPADQAVGDLSGAETATQSSGSGEMPIAAARPDGADDTGTAEPAGTSLTDSPVELGETVTVLDDLEVTVGEPRPVTGSANASSSGNGERLAVEATVVNGGDERYEVGGPLQLLGDVADLQVPEGGSDSAGYRLVEDESSGLTDTWSGGSLVPDGTAYGLFGFAVPADAPEDLYGVVWLVSEDDEPGYVVFHGSRP
jgi:hypothetical protein